MKSLFSCSRYTYSTLLHWGLNILCLFWVIVLVLGSINTGKKGVELFLSLTTKPLNVAGFVVLACLVLYIGFKILLVLWKGKVTKVHFMIIGFGMALGCFLVISNTSIDLQHDPKRYFEYALEVSNDLSRLNLNYIYHQRILTYTLPILYVLPQTLTSVQIVNVAMLLMSIGIYTYLIGIKFGNKTAFIFLLLLSLNIEFYFASAIASHDLASIFYFALLLLTIHYLRNAHSFTKCMIWIILAAFIVFVNDLQRSIKIPLLISMVALILLELKTSHTIFKFGIARHLAMVVVFSVTISGVYQTMVNKYSNNQSSDVKMATMLYSYNDLYSLGDYHAGTENRYNYMRLIEPENIGTFALEKYTTQISEHPINYILFIKNKTNHFFQNSFYHYFMDERIVGKPLGPLLMMALSISFLIKVVIYVLAAIGLILMLLSFKTSHYGELYIIYPLFFLPIILQSEVNPTYSLLVMPSTLFFGAYAINFMFERSFQSVQRRTSYKTIVVTAINLILVLGLFWATAQIFRVFTPLQIFNFKRNTFTTDESTAIIEKQHLNTPFEIQLTSLETEKVSSIKLKADKPVNHISFFISSEAQPDDLVVSVNDVNISYRSFQSDLREHKTSKNYYYYNYNYSEPTTFIEVDVYSSEAFLLKDVFLE